MRRVITVSEIFGPTIQGEGALAGLPTVFVRTGGCDLRCKWCDSMHAVDPAHKDEWEEMDEADIFDRILDLSGGNPLLVTLSGGNPALQPLGDLILKGGEMGYTFALETQGTASPAWLAELAHLVLSPKPPSSGMSFNQIKLERTLRAAEGCGAISFKFVVFDEEDYVFARRVAAQFPLHPVYLQAGTTTEREGDGEDSIYFLRDAVLERMEWLASLVIRDKWFEARVSCQQHVLLWGDKKGV